MGKLAKRMAHAKSPVNMAYKKRGMSNKNMTGNDCTHKGGVMKGGVC